ncbi:hypothetical protein KOW79_008117 [Hemibagrus wyckioides]|uniref:Uncharacterized protein n=1 Tax=Hemibagrus wyckioides TaxID=337641 RepID=A0A9D3SQU9_9TELE|nr:hypothetical protein KOW79_008117 [Hemibagrus wyckioides]
MFIVKVTSSESLCSIISSIFSSTMDLADRLCNELFRWIEKQEECAEHLMDLAKELEEMTTAMTAGQLVGNTATVLGSAALIGSGIATFLTGGLAAPLLVISAGITAGVGTVASVTFKLLDSWKSSKSMKDAEKTSGEIEKIWRNIESLQKKLSEEYKSQDLAKDFSFDEVQCEITARMLRAMGKRSGRYLPLSYLTRILRNDGMYRDRYQGFVVGKEFITCVSTLLVFTGFYLIFVNTATKKGAKHVLTTVIKTGMATMKTLLKGTSQAAGGAIGLVFALPDLIDNCEKLFKGENQTDASSYLRKKATEIRVAVKKIKKQLNELQEMLNEIPETECHVDLATEMCGNQTYIRGTVCMEYKQTKKQDRKVQEFIFLSTKDMGETKITSTNHGVTARGSEDKFSIFSSTMDLADKLCTELFRWIAKQEECAEHLMDLAEELEEMTKAMNKGQLVGNTTTVVGSAALIGTGIATFLTGGLAAPLLVMAAGVAAGVGTVTSVTCKLLESWKCSKTMKNAQKTAEELEEIQKNIEMLQKKLSEDSATKGAEYITKGVATISLKTALKGTGQVTGGVFGLVLTLPDLIDNCEQLVKNKHETEASKNLRTKAAELRDAVTNIKKQMNELQEMLSEIPETKCHVDLATEMCGLRY